MVSFATAFFVAQVRFLGQVAAPYTDEGDHLYAAVLIGKGAVPYRDFFYLHPPAFASLLAVGLRLTHDLHFLRCLYLAANVLGAVLLFYSLKSLSPRSSSAAGALLAGLFFLSYDGMVRHDFRFMATRQFANSFIVLPFFFLATRRDSRLVRTCKVVLATVMALHLYQGFLDLVLLSFGLDTIASKRPHLRTVLTRQVRIFALPVAALACFLLFFPEAYQCSVVEHFGPPPRGEDLLYRLSVLLGDASDDRIFGRTGVTFLVLGALFLREVRGLCVAMLLIIAATFLPSEFFPHYFVLSAPALAFGVFAGFELLARWTRRPAVATGILTLLLLLQWNAVYEDLLGEWNRKDPEFYETVAALKKQGEPFLTFMNPIYAVEAGKELVPHRYSAQMRFFRVAGNRYSFHQYNDLVAKACTIVLSEADIAFLGEVAVDQWRQRYPARQVGQVLVLQGDPANCRSGTTAG